MKAKSEKLNEMSRLLSRQDKVNGDLLFLFGRFELGTFLHHLRLESNVVYLLSGYAKDAFILSSK